MSDKTAPSCVAPGSYDVPTTFDILARQAKLQNSYRKGFNMTGRYRQLSSNDLLSKTNYTQQKDSSSPDKSNQHSHSISKIKGDKVLQQMMTSPGRSKGKGQVKLSDMIKMGSSIPSKLHAITPRSLLNLDDTTAFNIAGKQIHRKQLGKDMDRTKTDATQLL